MTDPSVYFNPYCVSNSHYHECTSKDCEFLPQTPKCSFTTHNPLPKHNQNPFWNLIAFFTNKS